ncbi:hypothetical protein PoB_004590400, partial [Plakobranchus ocellatus]
LPYVATAAGPLLSLLMVTLEEWAGLGGPPADTLLKLKERKRECKRNMIGVYKKSLILESQLHQYLNPGLVTSLNRRLARASFEAETMVALIDRLRKESKKSVVEPERKKKVIDVSMRLKSLLGRQKCEWQCVGRLKETLTMAREMKDLLRFIARLSNTLERSKAIFGGLQDRPPPYDFSSPYEDIPKTTEDIRKQHKMISQANSEPQCIDHHVPNIVDKQSNCSQIMQIRRTAPVCHKSPGRDVKSEIYLKSSPSEKESVLSSEACDTGSFSNSDASRGYLKGGRGIKAYVSPRRRSLSPRKFKSFPQPQRSRSTDCDFDVSSSPTHSEGLSKAIEGISANSNE